MAEHDKGQLFTDDWPDDKGTNIPAEPQRPEPPDEVHIIAPWTTSCGSVIFSRLRWSDSSNSAATWQAPNE